MASFTQNKPKADRVEWKEYAKNNGYCLEYKVADIRRAMEKEFFDSKTISNFDKIYYTNTPFELAPFYSKCLKKI